MSKIRTVMIEISRCYKCPYFRNNDLTIRAMCWCDKDAEHRYLDFDDMNIPEWCPLPEKKDEY